MAEIVGGEWLTVEEAAGLAKVSEWTVYRACELGEIRHVRIAGRRAIRLSRQAVDEWLLRFEQGEGSEDKSARRG